MFTASGEIPSLQDHKSIVLYLNFASFFTRRQSKKFARLHLLAN